LHTTAGLERTTEKPVGSCWQSKNWKTVCVTDVTVNMKSAISTRVHSDT
jgi:hypothetical protein